MEARELIVIVVANRHGSTSSKSGRGWLHQHLCKCLLEGHESISSPSQYKKLAFKTRLFGLDLAYLK